MKLDKKTGAVFFALPAMSLQADRRMDFKPIGAGHSGPNARPCVDASCCFMPMFFSFIFCLFISVLSEVS